MPRTVGWEGHGVHPIIQTVVEEASPEAVALDHRAEALEEEARHLRRVANVLRSLHRVALSHSHAIRPVEIPQ